jgi:thiosulfate dehydrogenase [quinone] large subunit
VTSKRVPAKPAPPAAPAPAPDVTGRVLLPLRAFLGVTFCYAGLQKLANPAFLDAASPASIQAQLAGAARRSPVHALLTPLTHLAVPLGLLIALGELAVGTGTLLGFRARAAAAGGIALSLMLFLTVSFHTSPYYTGADIVFAFAWTPLLLAGPGTVLSLDAAITRRAAQQTAPGRPQAWRSGTPRRGTARREVVLRGTVTAAVAAGGLVVGGLAAGLGRLAGGTSGQHGEQALSPTASSSPASSSPASSGPASSSPASSGPAGSSPPGQPIGPASDVPVGQAASFTDPSSGDPSLVIHPAAGTFVAFDAVCPHAGCTVGYDPAQKVIACPCHGSQFNASTGAVEVGPAATGLRKLGIAEGTNGQLYVS